jgi:hypothetical protein
MKSIIRSLAVFTSVLALLLALGSTALADTASPATLSVDTGSHQVTAAAGVFTPGELIDLWYNLPDGSAAPFVTGATGMVSAGVDGSLSATIASDDWNAIPLTATSIVAHGASSGVNAVYVFTR